MKTERPWLVAQASVAGSSHENSSTVCQDAHSSEIVQSVEGPVLVVAVSDGAGSACCAEIGSRIAVNAICEQATEYFIGGGRLSAVTRSLMSDWFAGVREQIADAAAHGAMRDYACTLLVTMVGNEDAAFAQLGDGAMVALTRENGWAWIFWPQHGEYANTTYFVTEDGALDQFEFECRQRQILEVATFTDGLEQLVLDFRLRTPHEPFFHRMFAPLRSTTSGDCSSLSKHLESYLVSPGVRERTDDDVTLVLARRASPTEAASELVHVGDDDAKPY